MARAKKTDTATTSVTDEKRPQSKEKTMSDHSILDLDMNLDQYEDFEALPAGSYPATITQAELRISDKGNEFFYVVFTVHPDDYPADYAVENAPEGTKLTYARMQKPDSKNRRSITAVKKFMNNLGMSLATSTINPGEWEGKKAKLTLKRGEFNGSPTNEIVAIEALD